MVGIRSIGLFSIFCALGACCGWLSIQPGSSLRKVLQLPSAEASSPDGILFYGACFDYDAYVWCLDRSCSMGWGAEIDSVKVAVSDALFQLTPDDQFSLVTYSDSWVRWSSTLVSAEPAEVSAAVSWVQAITPAGGTCIVGPVLAAIAIADDSSNGCVLLVGDGVSSCGGQGSLDTDVPAIAAGNPGSVPIHTFYVSGASAAGPYLEGIADAFGGVYVDTTLPLDLFRRGDANSDGGVDVSDVVFVLAAGFVPGSPQPICLDAVDCNDDGAYDPIVDAIALLQSIFVPGSAPLALPGDQCGTDPTPDPLACTGVCP